MFLPLLFFPLARFCCFLFETFVSSFQSIEQEPSLLFQSFFKFFFLSFFLSLVLSVAPSSAGLANRRISVVSLAQVLVHSDHCAKKLLPWFDGMLEADEAYFKEHGEPLFSSHMLDLSAAQCSGRVGCFSRGEKRGFACAATRRSEEPDEENIEICAKYLGLQHEGYHG